MFYFFAFLFGLIIGSFLNCLIWRLYKEESLLNRSYCPKCRKQISWYDNVPILSFIFLKGRCRHCHETISWQYPLVEFITGALFLLAYYFFQADSLFLIKALLVISVMTVVFIYDCRWFLISIFFVAGAGILFLILDLLLGVSIWQILISLIIGAGFFALQFFLTKGKGIGEGDIWLGGLLGIIFPNLALLISSIFLSYLIGAASGIFLIIGQKKGLKSKVPLGVFLALGTIITLFLGEKLIFWYLGMF